jgi:HEAT repeat protein
MTQTIKEVVEQYRQGAIGTGDISDPKKANKSARQMIAAYRILRETEEGRQAIASLLQDDEPSVRCYAAAQCLQWKPDVAHRVLEALRDSQGPFSFDAEMTLKEYEKGRLTFDY